jgi:hypothetical protein
MVDQIGNFVVESIGFVCLSGMFQGWGKGRRKKAWVNDTAVAAYWRITFWACLDGWAFTRRSGDR